MDKNLALLKKALETDNIEVKDNVLEIVIAQMELDAQKVTIAGKVEDVKGGLRKFGAKLPKVNVEFRHKEVE